MMTNWNNLTMTVVAGGQRPAGTTSSAPAPVQIGSQILPLVLLFVVFYFLLIRPQQKKVKEHEKMVQSAKTGDKVVAAGGIYGIISNVKDDSVLLKISDNVKIEVLKSSITTVIKPAANETSEN